MLNADSACTVGETTPESAAPQWQVNYPPRLQLGNAPLAGYPGGEHDQVDLLWQTIPAGEGAQDCFRVEFRSAGLLDWLSVDSITTDDLEFQGRMNHQAEIRGLQFDAAYEYRVQHLRAGEVVETFQSEFRTRLPAGDAQPFTIAAYGDSADLAQIEHFRSVQARINQRNPDFVLLLGDNAYQSGDLQEYDGRFDPDIVPEAVAWTASHIDYLTIGNHDGSGTRWVNSAANYSVPIPEAGVNSPAAPNLWPQETAYSFQYGNTQFLTFNSMYYNNPALLEQQMDYAAEVFAVSDAQWKVVFAHHALAAAPDKTERPQDAYYSIVAPRLEAAGVDLLLVAHSHTFSWTRPMLGQVDGKVLFVPDTDKDYDKDAGLVQVIAGTGGRSLRGGLFPSPFVGAGFSSQTTPPSEFGFAEVQFTPEQLTVRYVAADDGSVLGQFTITDRTDLPHQINRVFLGSDTWSDSLLDELAEEYNIQHELGILVTRGDGQRQPLPLTTLNQVSIQFDQPLDVGQASATVRDLYTGKVYTTKANGFTYSMETRTATWTLTEPLATGNYVVELHETSDTGQGTQNSRPLRPEFFLFSVLHADINHDGQITAADVVLLNSRLGQSSGVDFDGDSTLHHADVDYVIEELLRPRYGDANLDGLVDFADFLLFSQHFGNGTRWVQGDFDSDDDVDFADFLLLSSNFGVL